jgi:soluble lytic murein transglycosylase-like protein
MSAEHAQRQLGSSALSGVAASERLAGIDLDRVERIADRFADVAGKFGTPPAILAAIASRESGCGRLLDGAGRGDRGNAFGIMQVDRRHHMQRGLQDPACVEHIEQGAGIFDDNLQRLSQKFSDWSRADLLRGAAAAYNFGLKHVKTRAGIDVGTTGNDYGADVMARARYFQQHPRLRAYWS